MPRTRKITKYEFILINCTGRSQSIPITNAATNEFRVCQAVIWCDVYVCPTKSRYMCVRLCVRLLSNAQRQHTYAHSANVARLLRLCLRTRCTLSMCMWHGCELCSCDANVCVRVYVREGEHTTICGIPMMRCLRRLTATTNIRGAYSEQYEIGHFNSRRLELATHWNGTA